MNDRHQGPRLIILVLAAALACGACQEPRASTVRLELNDGWTFTLASSPEATQAPDDLRTRLSSWLPATVPGTVHTDLQALDLIPDPFWGSNETILQWIGQEDWTYRTEFDVPARDLEHEDLTLVFHGLDTFTEVVLNGSSVLTTDNMFRTWTVPVKSRLVAGKNSLEVRFRSPIPPALEARAALPYELPAGNDRGDPPSRVFVRKAAYHYGWDWGPRFVTSGIWRPAELVAYSGARLGALSVTTDSLVDEAAFLSGSVTVHVSQEEADRRRAGGNVPIGITVSSPDGAFQDVQLTREVEGGENHFTFGLRVDDPILWWSNGLGEPHLYTVTATLDAGRRVDTLTTRAGIRTLELVTEPDSIGESFYFRLNGIPVFMKGANIIPLDHFSPRVTEGQYRELFADVIGANMNMLRVWGGGIYETDLFYDLADEHGVLIWQDFMFANGMYPGDSLFLATVQAEATDQVRRLRGHPSLALWCGNNEMEEGWQRWGWARAYDSPADSAAVRQAYEAIFHDVLPTVVEAEDPGRRYWPSSPSLGWGDPESLNRGDSHYWGVWHGEQPFDKYAEKLPRFSSEYGFQAFPPMETIAEFVDSADWTLDDPELLVHQKHPIGNELITRYMERDYPVPGGFEDFVYVSQLLQARGMRVAFEAHRRAMPRTMGTLYWQLNDTWPVVSWSSRDYAGRWKALHYAAREAFAPLLLSPVLRGDTLEVWGVSDELEPVSGTLRLEVLDFAGRVVWTSQEPNRIPAKGSTVLWRGLVADLLEGEDAGKVVFVSRLEDSRAETLGRERLFYFVEPKDLGLEAPTIHIDSDSIAGGVRLTLESDVLAKGVYLRAQGARFSENFFDLLPGRPVSVTVETAVPPQDFEAGLTVRTLAEVPREGVNVEVGNAGR